MVNPPFKARGRHSGNRGSVKVRRRRGAGGTQGRRETIHIVALPQAAAPDSVSGCAKCAPQNRLDSLTSIPEAWRSVAEHPRWTLADWLPPWIPEHVYHCRFCETLWHARQGPAQGKFLADPLPAAAINLMQDQVTIREVIDCLLAGRNATFDLIHELAGFYVWRARYSLQETANALLGSLENGGVHWASARLLMRLLNGVILRAGSEEFRLQPGAHGGGESSPHERFDFMPGKCRALRNEDKLNPPRGEVNREDALIRLESLKPAVALPFEHGLYAGLSQTDKEEIQQELLAYLKGILSFACQSENRRILWLSDEDWDRLVKITRP